jgi:hypothetical protein
MLQQRIFPKHSGIAYLGKPFADKALAPFSRSLAWDDDRLFDAAGTAEAFANAAENRNGRVLLLSDEAFLGPPAIPVETFHERIRRVTQRPRIIYTLRRQQDLLRSLVLLELNRRTETVTARSSYARMRHRSYASFVGLLFYDRDVETLYRLYGRENVLILLFEEMLADRRSYFARLTEFLHVDLEEMLRLFEQAGRGVHASMSVEEASFVSFRVERLPLARYVSIDRAGGWLFKKLRLRGDAERTIDRIERDARKMYAESNRKLAGLIPYDLKQYGYFL